MTDDELVERFFPCAGTGCRSGAHDEYCPASQRDKARRLAAAVREAVLKRVRVCGTCDGSGKENERHWDQVLRVDCAFCDGRGVVDGET